MGVSIFNKKAAKKMDFLSILPKGKKGAEMWQLVLIIISILVLLFLMIFYGQIDDKIGGVFEKLFGWL